MPTDSLIGRPLDNYRLIGSIGQGAMAHVYRALEMPSGRSVAIKVIDSLYQADVEYMQRFEREAQIVASLDHPHIVPLYSHGNVEDVFYIAMAFVDGVNLQHELSTLKSRGELMPLEQSLSICRQMCLALDHAHANGIVHRDVKPANILLDAKKDAFLTDFGLALLPALGTGGNVFGSAHYVAPEQALSSAKAVDQSDFYSLGVILFEMVTGEVPFNAKDLFALARMHVEEHPPRPSQIRSEVSGELEDVILKALAKNSEDRFKNGVEMIAALEAAV